MTSQLSKRLGRRLAMITAATAVTMGLGAGSAFAASISVSPSSGLSATVPTEVAVSGSEFAPSTKYRIGVCSSETYGIFGIPACASTVEVTSNGSGSISAEVVVEKTFENVHTAIPWPLSAGQPEFVTCAGEPEVDDGCEVAVSYHNGTSSEIAAVKAISFE